jgi:hypothetical protein
MTRWLVALSLLLTACGATVDGAATWPGATLDRVVLTAADFPEGVLYDRVREQAGDPDGAGGASAMLSDPPGCSDGLTKVIAASAERGPGSAAKYTVVFDGARVVMTVLSWQLDLDELAATAQRCADFDAFFDAQSPRIPMTTTALPAGDGELMYRQTMRMGDRDSRVYMAFANVSSMAVFGLAAPADDPSVPVKAELPQAFFDIMAMQTERMAAL